MMKRLFLLFTLTSLLFFSACADAKDTQGEGIPDISVAGGSEIQPSVTETPAPQPSATNTPTPQPTATSTPTPQPPTEEELARERVKQKIWEAFEEVKSSKDIYWTGPYHELLLESRGTLHIAMITRRPVTKTEKNTYQGDEMLYLAFYDESRDEVPHFVCKYGNIFEADISSDGGSMYLSLITKHNFGEIEFYDMSSFRFGTDGCFEAAFAEDSLAYWQDRKAEFEEGGKVKVYKRKIRKAFFYDCLLNIPSKSQPMNDRSYSWEYETEFNLSQLVFDKPSSMRVLNESTVLADIICSEEDRGGVYGRRGIHGIQGIYGWSMEIVTAGPLVMQDGSVLLVYKEFEMSFGDHVAILLYGGNGDLLDYIYYESHFAAIERDAGQNCFEIHACHGSQGWERVELSGKVRAKNGKIVIEPDEEQGKEYVEDFSYMLQYLE